MNIKHWLLTSAAAALIASIGLAQAAEPTQSELMAKVKVSQARAGKTALATVRSGMIKSAELEQEHGALVWSFDIAAPKSKNIHEVLVNAITGKIVYTEIETPKAQAKEKAADQLEKQKQ